MDKFDELFLSSQTAGLCLEVVVDDGDNTGCLLGRVPLRDACGEYGTARLYLTDKIGETEDGNGVFSTLTVRVESATPADVAALDEIFRRKADLAGHPFKACADPGRTERQIVATVWRLLEDLMTHEDDRAHAIHLARQRAIDRLLAEDPLGAEAEARAALDLARTYAAHAPIVNRAEAGYES